MKIKTRLFLYNILIIFISSFLLLFILNYINNKSSEILYNVETITVDKNVNYIKKIMLTDYSDQVIAINLKRYNYDLYVYEDYELVYGKENSSLTNLLKNYKIRRNEIRTLFIDNATAVMKTEDNKIYFAVQSINNREKLMFFFETINPLQRLLTRSIIVIVLSLIIIILFAIIFSNNILNRVMYPIKLLKRGAERVQDGNFKERIVYENDDEFSSVINNFNDMQESLREKTEKAKIYENAKREMINGISHDIRTPLTVVKGNIKGIQDGVASTKEKKLKYLDIAYNRVIDIENLLNRLFDTFKFETDKIKFNKELVDIKEYVLDVINNNENVINKVIKLDFKSYIDKEFVYLDRLEFKRVFDNLINNAIKHNKEKENLKININIKKEHDVIKIKFKDNGKGIKEENLEKIFNEFFKEDKSRNNDKNSSGLGLFIVKKIVEGHGGTITAKNRKGLCFEIILKGEKNNG